MTRFDCVLPPPRCNEESASAYRAFVCYLDVGPGRTLDRAWSVYCEGRIPRKDPTRCPGQWTRWSSQHNWVDRAVEHDLAVADRRRMLRAERREKLDERRDEFEIETQPDVEAQYEMGRRLLERYDKVPATDMTQEKTEVADGKTTHTKSKVRGIRGGEVAQLMKQTLENRRDAILGPRGKTSGRAVEERKADHVFIHDDEEKDGA